MFVELLKLVLDRTYIMEDPVSYKGYFNSDAQEGPHEVRRFTVDKEKSNSLEFLKEKLVTVFPQIKDNEIFITWRDNDGDMVTIENDEDLMIAKAEMQGHLYKINVIIKNENKKKEGKGTEEKKERKDEHPGVIFVMAAKALFQDSGLNVLSARTMISVKNARLRGCIRSTIWLG